MNKDSWEVKKLGDIATYINGYSFKPSDWEDDGLPIIRIQNLNSSEAPYNYTTKRIDKKYVVNFGEILISWSASLGVYEWKGTSALLNQHIFKVQFDKIEINKFFFKYQVDRQIEEMLQHIHGATMKHITKKNFDNIRFLVPPPPIQEQIVKELDTLSDIITKKKEQLAELDKLAQATFYDMFGDPIKNEKEWEMRRLEELGDWASGGTPLRSNLLYFKGSIPWVTSGELNSLFINDTIEHINEEAIRNSNAKLIRKGSLLLGMYDTAALKSSINKREMACNQAIAFSFINTKLCNTIYVYYSIQINKEEYKKEQRGIRQKNLNLSMIKAISILYPPLLLQNQFAEKIEAIEKQKALINQSIADTQLLFDYTMDKYFN